MITISQIKTFPNGTPVPAIQAKVVGVYDYKPLPDGKFGPTSVQNIELQDASGDKIRASVWKHQDLAYLKGNEVVVQGSSKGGIKVKHGSYEKGGTIVQSIDLEISGAAKFEPLSAQAPRQSPQPSPLGVAVISSPSQTPPRYRAGQQVGMALNNAGAILAAAGVLPDDPNFKAALKKAAQAFLDVADELEQAPVTPVATPASPAKPAKDTSYETLANTKPRKEEIADEDIPF
jgi:hypothetical protein